MTFAFSIWGRKSNPRHIWDQILDAVGYRDRLWYNYLKVVRVDRESMCAISSPLSECEWCEGKSHIGRLLGLQLQEQDRRVASVPESASGSRLRDWLYLVQVLFNTIHQATQYAQSSWVWPY